MAICNLKFGCFWTVELGHRGQKVPLSQAKPPRGRPNTKAATPLTTRVQYYACSSLAESESESFKTIVFYQQSLYFIPIVSNKYIK